MRWLDAVLGRSPVVDQAMTQGPRFDVISRDEIAASYFGLPTWSDVGGIVPRVTRSEAIQVPAVKRSRDLICPTIGGMPLSVYDTQRVELVSDLLTQPERHCARSISITQLVEDLLFEQVAWWRVTERGFDGYPRFVKRVPPDRVSVDEARGEVRVDGQIVPSADLIRFDSPNDALLVAGARAIRTCLRLDSAAAGAAEGVPALDYFTPAEGAVPPEDDEVEDFLNDWTAARRTRRTAWVPDFADYHTNQFSPEQLQMADARQHAVLEIARAAGIDPEEVGVSTTSRTYSNQFDRRKQFVDFTLGPYLKAVEERLSLGDVTKRGYYVKFDLDAFYRSDALTRYQTYAAGLQVGALVQDEIRPMEDKPDVPGGAPMPQTTPVQASQFAATGQERTFDAPAAAAEFKVDLEKRTIRGLAVPFDVTVSNAGAKWSFSKGSLKYDDVSRVKFLDGHDWGKPLGRATSLEETDAGLIATFSVINTPAGDEALLMASERVKDGLSISVPASAEFQEKDGVLHAVSAPLAHVALTPCPAFDDARVTAVAASKEGTTVTDSKVDTKAAEPATETKTPEVAAQFTTEQTAALLALLPKPDGANGPEVIPAAAVGLSVQEKLPYSFDRGGNFAPVEPGGHVFSADLHTMARHRDLEGTETEAGKRVMGLLNAAFATVTTNVNELNPDLQLPGMYVDQQDYKTPLWDFANKGQPPNGVQPFTFPKYSSSSGLVGDHTEGTEPTAGSFVTTSQTVTPTAISGKASITREVWDMGGNPAVSTLIFNQMVRGWREGLESATATFLNTLTAATDIAFTVGATTIDDVLAGEWDAALADLQFVRGYDFSALALEKVLYKAFVAAVDGNGRKLYPIVAPQNANGTAQARFRTLDLGGVTGVPSWALPSTPGAANNSWLFDPMVIHGWASAPQRLEFPGTDASAAYAPVAMVDLAIWGYKAFANTDIGGVRQVIYDNAV